MVELVLRGIVLQGILRRGAEKRAAHPGMKVVLGDLTVAARANPGVHVAIGGSGGGGNAQPKAGRCKSSQAPRSIAEWVGRHERSIARAGRVNLLPARAPKAIRTGRGNRTGSISGRAPGPAGWLR